MKKKMVMWSLDRLRTWCILEDLKEKVELAMLAKVVMTRKRAIGFRLLPRPNSTPAWHACQLKMYLFIWLYRIQIVAPVLDMNGSL